LSSGPSRLGAGPHKGVAYEIVDRTNPSPQFPRSDAKFLLCANALGGWCLELEARGKGQAADIEKDLRANLIPGVTIVPAMVIAIEQAQAVGIRYNRQ
jgi:hypothetical protein